MAFGPRRTHLQLPRMRIPAHNTPMDFQAVIPTPFGALGIRCDLQHIDEIRFLPHGSPDVPAQNALAERAVAQLRDWLQSPCTEFDLPLRASGTAFQQRVWQAISGIGIGKVLTYGAIARQLNSAAQAVGQACGANPYPILVPCHRVVARQALGGFAGHRAGYLIETKQWLLQHEAIHALR